MPTQIANTATQIDFSANNQSWVIAPGIHAGGGVESTFSGSILVNHGNILDAFAAVGFQASDVLVYNLPGALMSGRTGLAVAADQNEIQNEGNIYGHTQFGIWAGNSANHVTITNSGTVFGKLSGVVIGSPAAMVASISNSGIISSNEHGIHLLNAAGAQQVIVNSGTVKGEVNSILAELGNRLDVTNTGALFGNVTGTSTNQSDTVTNHGTISGDVFLGSGVDLYKGTGAVSGFVFGEAGNDTLIGGAPADRLSGGADADMLSGNGGDDMLSGGVGTDTLAGGAGNDTYALENGTDAVTDSGGAADLVTSTISRSLAAAGLTTIERLTLGGAGAINGIGNNLANIILGNSAANILNGGLGKDAVSGGSGNDTLTGHTGNDVLKGEAGNDKLYGGVGVDRLTGGVGSDFFIFNTAPRTTTNRDTVTDFNRAADTFQLENAVFTKLGAGAAHMLNGAFFRAGPAALDANDHVIYNKATGVLSYDTNGNAAGGVQQIALLANKPALTAADFVVI